MARVQWSEWLCRTVDRLPAAVTHTAALARPGALSPAVRTGDVFVGGKAKGTETSAARQRRLPSPSPPFVPPDMSGMMRQAKPDVACPLDGGVVPHSHRRTLSWYAPYSPPNKAESVRSSGLIWKRLM